MAKVTVAVEGLRETVRSLEQAGVDVNDLKDVFQPIATAGADVLAPLLPRRSGRLSASVRGNRAKNKAVVRIGSARVPYAGPILYGWPKRNIKPAVSAIQQHDSEMGRRAPEMLEDGLTRVFEKYDLI